MSKSWTSFTSFAVNNVEKLNVNFCFVLYWTLPLFSSGVRLSQCMRILEISSWDDVEGGHFHTLTIAMVTNSHTFHLSWRFPNFSPFVQTKPDIMFDLKLKIITLTLTSIEWYLLSEIPSNIWLHHKWPSTLVLWILPWNFVLTISQKLLNTNFFIFSGYISLTWDLCTVWSFWPFDLCPWNYDLWLWNHVWKLLFGPAEGYSVSMLYLIDTNIISNHLAI